MSDSVLAPSAVVVGAAAKDKEEAIDRVGRLLVDHGYVTVDYIDAMRDREAIISTYLGNGIALPHGTSEAQSTMSAATCSLVVNSASRFSSWRSTAAWPPPAATCGP